MSKICPVTGKMCSQKKIYHVTELVDGKVVSLDFCPLCFQAYVQGLEKKPAKFVGGELEKTPLLTPSTPPKKQIAPPQKVQADPQVVEQMLDYIKKAIVENTVDKVFQDMAVKECPHCHWTEIDIAKKGKLGCPKCYDYYGKDLEKILFYAHGTPNSPEELHHVGKVPKRYVKEKKEEEHKMKLVKLQYKLMKAVEVEDYETAAKIRDEIAALSGE